MKAMRCLIALAAVMCAPALTLAEGPRQLTVSEIYTAKTLEPLVKQMQLSDRPGVDLSITPENRGGFNFFSDEIKDLDVQDGKLGFTVAEGKGALGWGSHGYVKGQKATPMFHGLNVVTMRVKQSAAQSQWTLTLWADGKSSGDTRGYRIRNRVAQTLRGDRPQELTFAAAMPGADGFVLEISGTEPNTVQIESIEITQPVTKAFYRKEFVLPEGAEVWRAIASFSYAMTAYVNGRPLNLPERNPANIAVQSVDIAQYLKPGANCIAMAVDYVPTGGRSNSNLFVYCQGGVILTDGAQVRLDSDAAWQCSDTAADGWNTAGFNAAGWQAAAPTDFPPGSRYSFYRSNFYPLIAYDGLIQYQHPGGGKLSYRADEPAIVQVRVPQGLAARDPQVAWRAYLADGVNLKTTQIKDGVETQGVVEGNSLLFNVNLGKLDFAVYTIETTLRDAQGEIIEQRYQEPLAVYDRLPMKEISGDFFEQGMDLELVEDIDFTKPREDKHEIIEKEGEGEWKHRGPPLKPITTSEAKIVNRNGLVYRETKSTIPTSLFGCKLNLEHPGDWYVMELQYPDDAQRKIGISVNSWPSEAIATDTGVGVITGGMDPLSNTMKTFKWVYRADTGEQSIYIVNLRDGATAAAASLNVYHVKDPYLPAVAINASGERFMGPHIERAIYTGINFGINFPGTYGQRFAREKVDLLNCHIYRLAWNYDVAKHNAQYLRFIGANFHVMGAYQYSEVNHSYVPPHPLQDTRISADIRDVSLRLFAANGISMMSIIEYVRDNWILDQYAVSDKQVRDGADTIMPVLDDGRQSGCLSNFIHPRIERAYLQIVDDLAAKFSDSPAWKGIYLMPFPHQYGFGPTYCPRLGEPLSVGYSDATTAEFEKDTGIAVPGEGPQRFSRRAGFLTSPEMRDKWIAWRCRRQAGIAAKTTAVLKKRRDDLFCIMANYTAEFRMTDWLAGGRTSYRESNLLYGWDSKLFENLKDTWLGRYFLFTGGSDDTPGKRAHRISPEVSEFYDSEDKRSASVMDAWRELSVAMPADSGWPTGTVRILPKPAGDMWKEPFAEALIGNDPQVMLFAFADVGQQMGQEQKIRDVAKVITSLPGKKLPLVLNTGIESNVAIRAGDADGKYYFYVVNPACWSIKGEVTLEGAGEVRDLPSGKRVVTRAEGGKTVVPFELCPFGMKAFVTDDARSRVGAFRTGDAWRANSRRRYRHFDIPESSWSDARGSWDN